MASNGFVDTSWLIAAEAHKTKELAANEPAVRANDAKARIDEASARQGARGQIVIYNKLVRDGIPDEVASHGRRAAFRTLTDAEYAIHLRQKLVEEVAEYLETPSDEELGDITEVVNALRKLHGPSGVDYATQCKFERRGGFTKRLLMLWAELRPAPESEAPDGR